MAIVALKNVRRLRDRLEIRAPTSVKGASGDVTNEWLTEDTVWGAVYPVSFQDQERFVAGGTALQQAVTHKVTVRSIPGLTTQKRFRFQKTRILEIVGIGDRSERGLMMEILCKEVVDPNG